MADYIEKHKYKSMMLNDAERTWVPMIYDHLMSLGSSEKVSYVLGSLRGIENDLKILWTESEVLEKCSFVSLIKEKDYLSVYKKIALQHLFINSLASLLKEDNKIAMKLLLFLLYKGIDPGYPNHDDDLNYPLHYVMDDLERINLLLDANADPLVTNDAGISPLYIACGPDINPKILESLLKKADAEKLSIFYLKNIKIFSTKLLLVIIEYLDSSYLMDSSSLLMETILNLKDEEQILILLEALIKRGSSVLTIDGNGINVLWVAIYHHMSSSIIELIIKNDDKSTYKEYSHDGMNVLHVAANFGNTKGITILVEKYGMDINAKCAEKKKTPLYYAILHEKFDCIRELIRLGASTDDVNFFKTIRNEKVNDALNNKS